MGEVQTSVESAPHLLRWYKKYAFLPTQVADEQGAIGYIWLGFFEECTYQTKQQYWRHVTRHRRIVGSPMVLTEKTSYDLRTIHQ